MNKPEKKSHYINNTNFYVRYMHGWNDCYDNWERWLPSIIEIKDILNTTCQECKQNKEGWCQYTCSILAKAISKRIKGEA